MRLSKEKAKYNKPLCQQNWNSATCRLCRALDIGTDHCTVEKKLVQDGLKAIKRCADNGDIESVYAILKLCKAVAGDKVEVFVELSESERKEE